MPFGLIFGALFFGLFCGLFGLRLMVQPVMAAKLGGMFLALLGGSLALGLLLRRSWARWAGVFAAVMLAGFGLRLVALHGNVSDHLLLFASLGTAALLLVPATGDPRRGAPVHGSAEFRGVGGLGWTALVSLVGVLGAALWATPQSTVPETRAGALPAAAIGRYR